MQLFYAPPSSTGDNVVPVKLTWQQAEDFCTEFRGHLASIGNSDEQAVLMRHFPKVEAGYLYWIGLHEQRDGSWAWSDGQPYGTTTFWHPTEQGSSQLLDCVGMDSESGMWMQQNCNLGAGWICQIPKGFYYDGEEIPAIPSPITTNGNNILLEVL
jgi:Lectin C-type domain